MAQRLFGASANLKPLAGEYDLNFLATWYTQSCILKVMRPDCEHSFIDMKIKCEPLLWAYSVEKLKDFRAGVSYTTWLNGFVMPFFFH